MRHHKPITLCFAAAAILASYGQAQADSSASNAQSLQKLLDAAQPGDVIRMDGGNFSGVELVIKRSGKPGKPITLQGTPSSVIKSTGYGLHLQNVSYWKITGLTIDGAKKGIVLDASSNVLLDNLTVRNTNEEAVHFRKNSHDNVLTGSRISNTGKKKPAYGEAVYVGTAESNWKSIMGSSKTADKTTNTCISRNQLGPNVTTEAIDVKEGSSYTYVLQNEIDLSGISGENFGDSGLDMKGNYIFVFNNRFSNTKGTFIKKTKKVPDAMQSHRIDNPANAASGTNVWVWNNVANLKSASAPKGYTPGMLFLSDGKGSNHYCPSNTVANGDAASDLAPSTCGGTPPKVPASCPDVLR